VSSVLMLPVATSRNRGRPRQVQRKDIGKPEAACIVKVAGHRDVPGQREHLAHQALHLAWICVPNCIRDGDLVCPTHAVTRRVGRKVRLHTLSILVSTARPTIGECEERIAMHRPAMAGYASRTGTRRNLAALRDAGWRLLVSAEAELRTEGMRYALDNGA
jgi:hypothetical protein